MVSNGKTGRGDWAAGLQIKDATKHKVDILFHAGCRTCYDKSIWTVAQDTVALLQKTGLDFGTTGDKELCCGSRAYQMGYREDFLKQAKRSMALIEQSGAETLVTGCADCYYAFKVLYDRIGLKGNLKVLHATEFFDGMIKNGRLKPTNKVTEKVTYHDPCHLGRLGEPYIRWQGKEVPGHIRVFDPPREFRRGTHGIYGPPRDVLKSIPGIELMEMDRTKEYARVLRRGRRGEDGPDFAGWTAKERIEGSGVHRR
jgi:Fe-S oxidoreductase